MVDNFLWDLFQQRRIHQNQKDNHENRKRIKETATDNRTLAEKHEQLCLVCEAIWEMLRDGLGLTETQLLNKVEEIDLRDGEKDGKVSKIKHCNACGRKMNPRRGSCVFCGNRDIIESAFEKV